MAIALFLRKFNPTKIITKLPLISTQNFIKTSFISSEAKPTSHKLNTKVNFSPFESSDSEPDPEPEPKPIDLPPPYDPFNDKPINPEPEDPTNLQEVFHKMRTNGLINNAVKMFDEMSKQGCTHEALELFKEINDKGKMPDVVAHTAVIEAYANAGHSKQAHEVFLRMLASGVLPNMYTYSVLIKSLASSGDVKMVGEAKKRVVEMVGRGMRPNAETCVAVFEAIVREGGVVEARKLLEEMKGSGFKVDGKGVREALKGERGHIVRSVMDVLLAK